MTRKSNVSLQQWHMMGGQTVDDGMILDKTVHKSINSQSSVLKVHHLSFLILINPLSQLWIDARNSDILSFIWLL